MAVGVMYTQKIKTRALIGNIKTFVFGVWQEWVLGEGRRRGVGGFDEVWLWFG